MHKPARTAVALFLTSAAVATLSACTPAVDVAPAQASADPNCSPMMVALPQTLQDFTLRETSSQGTAAWGDPAKIVLRCGVTPSQPTTEPCATVDGVDWLIQQTGQDPDQYTALTYGRTPATAVTFRRTEVASSTILGQLASAVSKTPQQHKCLSQVDSQQIPTVSNVPSPSNNGR